MMKMLTKLLVASYTPLRAPSKTVAIMVPVSNRNLLTSDEQISLRHLRRHLAPYDKFLIAPKGLKLRIEGLRTLEYSRKYFGSMRAHSRLLYLPTFWKTFADYKYILIYHLDALVFADQLLHWCETDFDYIGAPFLPCADTPWVNEPYVGNGGFTLMKVETVLRVLYTRYRMQPAKYWEDRCAGLLNVTPKDTSPPETAGS